jgi:hypothetical protein
MHPSEAYALRGAVSELLSRLEEVGRARPGTAAFPSQLTRRAVKGGVNDNLATLRRILELCGRRSFSRADREVA